MEWQGEGMDITYIPMARGFVYLAAVVDWSTRRVLAWRLSITMAVDFCLEAVEDALAKYPKPEIFNTDQGEAAQGSACEAGGMADEGASSPAPSSPGCCWTTRLPSAWTAAGHGGTTCLLSDCGGRSNTRRWCAVRTSCLRFRQSGTLPEMGDGPPESACRGRLQTATSCEGKEPPW
jgi:integrase-like protein